MAKKDLYHYTKRSLYLIVLAGVAATTIATALTFFAKASTVQVIDDRVTLGLSQQIVHAHENDLEWTKSQVTSEQRTSPPTPAETEIIKKKEEKLAEVKSQHKDQLKVFEERHKQAF